MQHGHCGCCCDGHRGWRRVGGHQRQRLTTVAMNRYRACDEGAVVRGTAAVATSADKHHVKPVECNDVRPMLQLVLNHNVYNVHLQGNITLVDSVSAWGMRDGTAYLNKVRIATDGNDQALKLQRSHKQYIKDSKACKSADNRRKNPHIRQEGRQNVLNVVELAVVNGNNVVLKTVCCRIDHNDQTRIQNRAGVPWTRAN